MELIQIQVQIERALDALGWVEVGASSIPASMDLLRRTLDDAQYNLEEALSEVKRLQEQMPAQKDDQ